MRVEKTGPKWQEINLDKFSHNLNIIRKHVEPAGIIPVVKADAYGHGLLEIALCLENQGFELLAVATLDEAIYLRQSFIRMRILLLGAVPEGQIADILNYEITPTICDPNFSKALSQQALDRGQTIKVHFYVDSGMGRMGHGAEQAKKYLNDILEYPGVEVEAVYSHYAVADESDDDSITYTIKQRDSFREFVSEPSLSNIKTHLANSGGVLHTRCDQDTWVRPGLLTYGVCPDGKEHDELNVSPIMSLKCRPLYIKRMKTGDSIGYGCSTKLKRDSNIATLPVGYADGVPRRIADKLKVSIAGKKYPVAGRICMDMMMVDLGDDEIDLQAEVTLMGEEGCSVYDWAEFTDTIPYEILTHLGKRWSRVYLERGDVKKIVRSSL